MDIAFYKRLAGRGSDAAQRVVDAMDWSPDQPRDPDGKFGSGSGTGGHTASLSHSSKAEAEHTEKGNQHLRKAEEHRAGGNFNRAQEHYGKAMAAYQAASRTSGMGHVGSVLGNRIALAMHGREMARRGISNLNR